MALRFVLLAIFSYAICLLGFTGESATTVAFVGGFCIALKFDARVLYREEEAD